MNKGAARLFKHAVRLIGVGLFVYILYTLDYTRIEDTLAGFPLWVVLMNVPVFFVLIWLKTVRWGMILRMLGIGGLHFGGLYDMYMMGFFAGTVTPGRLGEVLRYRHVQRQGHGLLPSLVSVILDRLADMLVLGGIGYAGMYFFSSRFHEHLGVLNAVFALGTVGLVLVFVNRRRLLCIMHKIAGALSGAAVDFSSLESLRLFGARNFRTWAAILALTVISWMIYFAQLFVFARELGIPIGYLEISLAISISSIVTLLPVSVSGVGTRDAALVMLFGILGFGREEAVLVSFLILLVLIMNGLLSALFWLKGEQEKRHAAQADTP